MLTLFQLSFENLSNLEVSPTWNVSKKPQVSVEFWTENLTEYSHEVVDLKNLKFKTICFDPTDNM